jgi:hypothetical protein
MEVRRQLVVKTCATLVPALLAASLIGQGAFAGRGTACGSGYIGSCPPPQQGKTVNAAAKSGTVRVRTPGSTKFTVLTGASQIPVGSVLDTRKGTVQLVSAADSKGNVKSGDFSAGLFKVAQAKKGDAVTQLALTEKLTCGKAKVAAPVSAARKKRKVKGTAHGRFRTRGGHAAAVVRGTTWVTEDTCTTTRVSVQQGKVAVRDFRKKTTVIVTAGHSYTAK